MKSNGSGRAALLLAAGIIPPAPALQLAPPVNAVQLAPRVDTVSVPPSLPATLPLTKSLESSPIQSISTTTTIVNTVSSSQSVTLSNTSISTAVIPALGIEVSIPDSTSKTLTAEETNKKASFNANNQETSSCTPVPVEEKGSKTSLLLSLLSTPQKTFPIPDSSSGPVSASEITELNREKPCQPSITPLKGSNITSQLLSFFTSSQSAAVNVNSSPSGTGTNILEDGRTEVMTSVVRPLGDITEKNDAPTQDSILATTTAAAAAAVTVSVEGPAAGAASKNVLIPSSLLLKRK